MTAKEFLDKKQDGNFQKYFELYLEQYGLLKQKELLKSIADTFRHGTKTKGLSFSDSTFAQGVAETIENFPIK